MFLHLGEGDSTEESPQAIAVVEFELAFLSSTEKGSTGGLNDIFRANTSSNPGGQSLVSQSVKHAAILVEKLVDDLRIAITQSDNEALPAFFFGHDSLLEEGSLQGAA